MNLNIPIGLPPETDDNNFIDTKLKAMLNGLYTTLMGVIIAVNDDYTVDVYINSRKLTLKRVSYQIIGNSTSNIIISPQENDIVLLIFTKDEFVSIVNEQNDYKDGVNVADNSNVIALLFFLKQTNNLNPNFSKKDGIILSTDKIATVNKNNEELLDLMIKTFEQISSVINLLSSSITTAQGSPIANSIQYSNIENEVNKLLDILKTFKLEF